MAAVADTYDAVTSDRPYRKGRSREDVLNILNDVRGTQLCPDCVDTLIELLDDSNVSDEQHRPLRRASR